MWSSLPVTMDSENWAKTGKYHRLSTATTLGCVWHSAIASGHTTNSYRLIEDLEHEDRIICIRPRKPMQVRRIEKDVEKLEALYEEGFAQGEQFCETYGKYIREEPSSKTL